MQTDQAAAVEDAARAPPYHQTGKACFLPRLQVTGYPQAKRFMRKNSLELIFRSFARSLVELH